MHAPTSVKCKCANDLLEDVSDRKSLVERFNRRLCLDGITADSCATILIRN